MKLIWLVALVIGFFGLCLDSPAQSGDSAISSPTPALVYFIRTGSLETGRTFSYFDDSIFIGELESMHAFAYECPPGKHLFTVTSGYSDFAEGNLVADGVYVVDVNYGRGVTNFGLSLRPIEPEEKAELAKMMKAVKRLGLDVPQKVINNVEELRKQAASDYALLKDQIKQMPKASIPDTTWQKINFGTSENASGQFEYIDKNGWPVSSQQSSANIGLGKGLPYGNLGLRVGYNFLDGWNVFGGGGYSQAGLVWSAGIRKEFNLKFLVQPYLEAMYGVNAAISVEGSFTEQDEVYIGPSAGGGIKLNIFRKRGHHFDLGLVYPFRSDEYEADVERIKSKPNIRDFSEPGELILTVGFNFHIR